MSIENWEAHLDHADDDRKRRREKLFVDRDGHEEASLDLTQDVSAADVMRLLYPELAIPYAPSEENEEWLEEL